MRLQPITKVQGETADLPFSAKKAETASLQPHFLHAGQVFVAGNGTPVALILGSCVGVCIWDGLNGIGGAVHYMLPTWDGKGSQSARYGDVGISILLQKLTEAGANRGNLRAKVFGGGCLFDLLREVNAGKGQHIGRRNVDVATEMLGKAHVPVVLMDVGLSRGQRVSFRTDNGETVIKVL